MRKHFVWIFSCVTLILLAGFPPVAKLSDHADPMNLSVPETNITDLFFFPKGDQMILIFNVRRSLTSPEPYKLDPFEYVIHMDLHSKVSFESEEDRARYGGTIMQPEELKSDVTIKFKLNNDTSVVGGRPSFEGLKDSDRIQVYTGVREDPFTFPRFFGKNAISMVMSIPVASFPEGQQDWILWGSVYEHTTEQIDHVGRSNRTQLGRFDSLNELPPTEHIAEINRLKKTWDDRFNFLNSYQQTVPMAGLVQYVLQMRKYDIAPDVMIYTNRFPPGFPNGRQLPDDVAALTCATGDCILQELSFVEGAWPRATANDKPFLDEFPYLAEPWPNSPEKPFPKPSVFSFGFLTGILPFLAGFIGWPGLILIVIVVMVASWGLIEILRRLSRPLGQLILRKYRARLSASARAKG
jgi:hypothetical protein